MMKVQSPLRWAGGKRRLLPQLERFLPGQFRDYYEPFLGGGSMYFHLQGRGFDGAAFLSDILPEVVNFFQQLQEHPIRIVKSLAIFLQEAEREPEKFYYAQRRKAQEAKEDGAYAAARFLYLNKNSFNGLQRKNSKGENNTPWGKCLPPKGVGEEVLMACSLALKQASIAQYDFQEALKFPRFGDFVYLDPPYFELSKTAKFTGYSGKPFGMAEQEALARAYQDLDSRGCLVMLSNADVPDIQRLYGKFSIHKVLAARAINCKGSGRGEVSEVVVCNYPVTTRT
jgi:DNA adenine methylase